MLPHFLSHVSTLMNYAVRVFYENLINRGKKKMVALTALMHKIIVIANAKLRDLYANNLAITI